MRFTVFTPTYNRAYIISALYKSLCRQSFADFEWVVVDDGSADNTEELIASFIAEGKLDISYVKVPNGGKHRAINRGVELAKGELFFIVDSDDYLTDEALQRINEIERSIPAEEKSRFCGVCGLKGYSAERIVGNTFKGETLDCTSLERTKHGISGDKAEVFYTSVMKKYPFPVFEGENFLTEAVVWNRMAADGLKLRYFNETVYICDYLPDGLTANIGEKIRRSPRGYGLYLRQSTDLGQITGVKKWESYFEFYIITKKSQSIFKTASMLNCGKISFFFRIYGMKLFYRLYDR